MLKANLVNHAKTTHTINLKYCKYLPWMVQALGLGIGLGIGLKFCFGSAWPRARAVARTRRVLIVSTVQLWMRHGVRVMLPMGPHPHFMRFWRDEVARYQYPNIHNFAPVHFLYCSLGHLALENFGARDFLAASAPPLTFSISCHKPRSLDILGSCWLLNKTKKRHYFMIGKYLL